MVKAKERKKIKIALVSILTLTMLLGCLWIVYGQNKTVDAYSFDGNNVSSSEAITVNGLLKSGYENLSGDGIFDKDVFWDIITKISGISNPNLSMLTDLGRTPITAQAVRDNNDGKDIIITIGGKKWSVAYLSQNTSNEPILTLYLATINNSSVQNAQFNTYNSSDVGDYPANMYGTSYMRAKVLNNGGSYATSNTELTTANQDPDNEWAIYTMEKSADVPGSIARFIDVPDNMSWQHVQRAKEHVVGSSYGSGQYFHNNANDALDIGVIDDLSNNYEDKDGYTNWRNDKVWLPSFTETGIVGTSGMWNLAIRQRYKNSGYIWSRSARANSANSTYSYYASGNDFNANDAIVTNQHAVTPAFHLNLYKVAKTVITLDEPVDVDSPYNGQPQYLSNITDTNKTSWYDSSVMRIDYPATGMKDVDTYYVKVTITSTDKFSGTPDTSDPQHMESDTVRWFKFTITKKKIGVNLSLVNKIPQATDASGAICSGDTVANGRAPTYGFTYKNNVTGQTYTTYPTGIIGNYTATVEITNECNYELDPDTTLTIDFEITKTKVKKPSIGTLEKPYTGNPVTFDLSQIDDIDKIDVDVTSPADYASNVVTATDAGTYTVTFSLRDNGAATCWDTATVNDVDPYTIEIKIKEKDLNPTITCSVASSSWEVGETPTMTITDERISGANIDYYVYYLKSGDTTKYDAINSTKQVVGGTVIVEMPDSLSIGSYTFVVELSNATGNDNKNYYINGNKKEKSFTVIGGGITVTGDSIKWQVNGADIGALVNGRLLLTYNGNSYRFSVDDSNLRSMGVKIDTSKGTTNGLEGDIEQTNAKEGLYQVKVYLCNYDNTYETYNGSFTLNYEIQKAKYNLGQVNWNYDPSNPFKYTGNNYTVKLTNLPSTLSVDENNYDNNKKRNVGEFQASVLEFDNSNDNYMTPLSGNTDTYEGNFDWTITWKIDKATLNLEWEYVQIAGVDFKVCQVTGSNAQYVDSRGYKYSTSAGNPIALADIQIGQSAERYWVEAVLTDTASQNYEISEATKKKSFRVGSDYELITVELTSSAFTYDGNAHGGELRVTSGAIDISRIEKKYYINSVDVANELSSLPIDAGDYVIVLSLNESDEEDYALSRTVLTYTIEKAKIVAKWDTSGQIPVIADLDNTLKEIVGYIYYDELGNELESGTTLELGKTYKVKAILKGSNGDNYEFVAEDGETALDNPTMTDEVEFTIADKQNNGDGNGIGGIASGDNQGGSGTLDEIIEKIKDVPLWQLISGIISIILTIIFLSKTASYDNKRKKFNKKADKLESAYAGAFLGVATTIWTAIACVLMALAVVSFVMMMIAKSRCNKAEEEYEDRLDEYNRNKKDEEKENMRIMLMGMIGGNGNGGNSGGYAYAQKGVGADEMRLMINDAVTAMLPNVQQYLPQPNVGNDDAIKQIIKTQEELAHNQELLMKKLAEKPVDDRANGEIMQSLIDKVQKIYDQPVEKVIAREVAVANANDETIMSIIEGQKLIMQRLDEISVKQNAEPQVVEKIVEVPVEKIVEKEVKVEVPVEVEKIVEKIIEKEVPIEVEKVVEKEVIKEVPIEVEKIVEKEVVKEVKVEVPVVAPSKPKKEVAPRLSLDEAFAKLSKQQQKYFDGLKQYAMSKDKCKEMKSTYFTVLGQSSLNPLVKLTVKKDNVVALFKMEDEIAKDLRKDAGSKGTKLKVKETELAVTDAQAFATAKKMIDLREDQIERYQDLLKEQRAIRSKK